MILISIIGSFDTTLLNLVNEFGFELKRIVLVFDDTLASSKNLLRMQSSLEQFKKNHRYSYFIDTATIIDEDSTVKLDTIIDIASKHERVLIDITDALGSTSAYLGARAVNEQVSLVAFNPYENEYNIISAHGFKNHRLKRPLSIRDYVESLGYSIKEKQNKPIRDKEAIFSLFKPFASFQNIRSTLLTTKKIRFDAQKSMHKTLHALGIIDETGYLIDRNYLQGGLFEEYIYWIATEMGFDDVMISTEIIFDGVQSEGTLIHNEFDLLAFKNNRLYLFECKFTKQFELDDLIYKYMALKEHIKNDSKGIIITVNPKMSANIQTADINKIPLKLAKKAALFDIHVLSNIIQYDHLKKELNAIIHPQGNKALTPIKTPEKPKKYVYFLGGYDLEMFEIRKILESKNAKLIDNQLKWGAKTSDYALQIEGLGEDEVPVFIELELDYKPSRSYEIIDHHGDYAHRASSIEQIAQRFEVKLDRFQTLVGVNDKSHIRGLKKYGASTNEIQIIRQLDRQKQGVTEEDEELAKRAILNVKKINKIPVIETLSSHFSPITDRVSYEDFIIYSKTKLCLYTYKIKTAKAVFAPYLQNNSAYYGGDNQMFYCLKEGALSSEEINKLVMTLAKKF